MTKTTTADKQAAPTIMFCGGGISPETAEGERRAKKAYNDDASEAQDRAGHD